MAISHRFVFPIFPRVCARSQDRSKMKKIYRCTKIDVVPPPTTESTHSRVPVKNPRLLSPSLRTIHCFSFLGFIPVDGVAISNISIRGPAGGGGYPRVLWLIPPDRSIDGDLQGRKKISPGIQGSYLFGWRELGLGDDRTALLWSGDNLVALAVVKHVIVRVVVRDAGRVDDGGDAEVVVGQWLLWLLWLIVTAVVVADFHRSSTASVGVPGRAPQMAVHCAFFRWEFGPENKCKMLKGKKSGKKMLRGKYKGLVAHKKWSSEEKCFQPWQSGIFSLALFLGGLNEWNRMKQHEPVGEERFILGAGQHAEWAEQASFLWMNAPSWRISECDASRLLARMSRPTVKGMFPNEYPRWNWNYYLYFTMVAWNVKKNHFISEENFFFAAWTQILPLTKNNQKKYCENSPLHWRLNIEVTEARG